MDASARDSLSRWIGLCALLLLSACGDSSPPIDSIGPSAVEDLQVVAVTESTVALAWSAPDNDGAHAQGYDFRVSTADLATDWDSGTLLFELPDRPGEPGYPGPRSPGRPEQLLVGDLDRDTRYSFALQSWDEWGNRSPTSNVVWGEPADRIPPGPVGNMTAEALSATAARFAWTAPGEDGDEGQVERLEVRYALGSLDWETGIVVPDPPAPGPFGTTHQIELSGLAPAGSYELGVRGVDDGGNPGPVETVSVRTWDAPRIWAVKVDGSGDAPTVQAAIDSSGPGDAVEVYPGTYYENINLKGRRIHLRSVDGPEVTILDGSTEDNSVVTFNSGEGNDTILDGFTITGGRGQRVRGSDQYGGGILCLAASPTIHHNHIRGNSISANNGSGGGIHLEALDGQQPPIVERCRVENNFSPHNGGGISIYGPGRVRDNLIQYNRAGRGDGGGVYVNFASPPVVIERNQVYGNVAGDHGGGVLIVSDPGMVVTKNVILGNSSGELTRFDCSGAGLYVQGGGLISENTVAFNLSPAGKPTSVGGICAGWVDEDLVLTRNLVAHNSVGGIVLREDGPIGSARVYRNLLFQNVKDVVSPEFPNVTISENLFDDPQMCTDPDTTGAVSSTSPALQQAYGVIGARPDAGCED